MQKRVRSFARAAALKATPRKDASQRSFRMGTGRTTQNACHGYLPAAIERRNIARHGACCISRRKLAIDYGVPVKSFHALTEMFIYHDSHTLIMFNTAHFRIRFGLPNSHWRSESKIMCVNKLTVSNHLEWALMRNCILSNVPFESTIGTRLENGALRFSSSCTTYHTPSPVKK